MNNSLHGKPISHARYNNAHPLLRKLMDEAIKHIDFFVLESYRSLADQQIAFNTKHSKVKPGQSAHNYKPSLAVDLFPAPFVWTPTTHFVALSKVMLECAAKLDIPIRWGGDWDRDGSSKDETFVDMPHFELHPWRSFLPKGTK